MYALTELVNFDTVFILQIYDCELPVLLVEEVTLIKPVYKSMHMFVDLLH